MSSASASRSHHSRPARTVASAPRGLQQPVCSGQNVRGALLLMGGAFLYTTPPAGGRFEKSWRRCGARGCAETSLVRSEEPNGPQRSRRRTRVSRASRRQSQVTRAQSRYWQSWTPQWAVMESSWAVLGSTSRSLGPRMGGLGTWSNNLRNSSKTLASNHNRPTMPMAPFCGLTLGLR